VIRAAVEASKWSQVMGHAKGVGGGTAKRVGAGVGASLDTATLHRKIHRMREDVFAGTRGPAPVRRRARAAPIMTTCSQPAPRLASRMNVPPCSDFRLSHNLLFLQIFLSLTGYRTCL